MELVYKKDGFITKLFACLFIAMFVVMCVVGNSVFASTDFSNFDVVYNDVSYNIVTPNTIPTENIKNVIIFRYGDVFYCNYYTTDISKVCLYTLSNGNLRLEAYDSNNNILSDIDGYSFTYNFSNNSYGKVGSTTWMNVVLGSNDTTLLYSSCNLYDIDKTTIVFSNSLSERGATGDSEYDSYINGLIGSNAGNLGDIANDITSGNIGSSIEESDKTSINNISSKLGGGFSKIFGFFNFVDTVKKSIVDIYNLLMNTSEVPCLTMNFNHKYLKGEHVILDLSWYEPYKPYGDGIICAFFYGCFMWSVFKNLYNIISGQNSSIETRSNLIKLE